MNVYVAFYGMTRIRGHIYVQKRKITMIEGFVYDGVSKPVIEISSDVGYYVTPIDIHQPVTTRISNMHGCVHTTTAPVWHIVNSCTTTTRKDGFSNGSK